MAVYQRSTDALHADVDGEVVVMNIESLDYFALNPVAARIWELLGETALTREQLCERLLAEYEVDAARCEASVVQFLDAAVAQGVVSVA